MGAEESHIPLQPVPQNFGYMAVIFKMPDNIQVIHGNEAEYSVIEHVIRNTWKEGIQGTKRKCAGCVLCFKLNGLPFETGILSMNIREVACQILQHLHNIGWKHIISTNLTKERTWFSFIFAREKTHRITQGLAYVSMSSTDKFHFWNLHQHTHDEISQALHLDYRPGIAFEDTTSGGKNYEVTLNGSPWSSTTPNYSEARAILMKIFTVMMNRYDFLCAMNVKRTEDAFVFIPKPTHSNKETEFFIISLRRTNKIQVFKAPDDLISIIHTVLVDAFGKMSHAIIKTIDHQSDKVEFKYKSYTVNDQGAQLVMTKFIVCKLLEALKGQGWSVTTGFDMSRGLSNKSELLFQRSTPHPGCQVFCLSPVYKSNLCVINAQPRIINACRKVISCRWHLPLLSETQHDFPSTCVGFELGGKPWSDSGSCAYFTHSMLCHLLEEFLHKGFKIKLTADVIPESMAYDEGASFPHDPNAWWFMHKPAPVVPAASPVPECRSEMEVVPPLTEVLSYDFLETQPPTEPQIYNDPPPSYEMATREHEKEHI